MACILSSNCLITPGFSRNLLVDFQHGTQFLINHDMASKISGYPVCSSLFTGPNTEIFEQMKALDMLIEIPDEDIDLFVPLVQDFYTPSFITDAVIDYKTQWHDRSFLDSLSDLFCKHIELRIYDDLNTEYLISCFNHLKDGTIEAVDVYMNRNTFVANEINIINLLNTEMRFRLLYVSGVFSNDSLPSGYKDNDKLIFTTQEIGSEHACGVISPFHFSNNMAAFFESKHHNTCLHRKISIDAEGYIKNCPSMAENFGNIKDTTLKEALEKPGFKKYWNIKKDDIAVCKDCEFRYICTDCRAYIENPDDVYSKPLKCGYNPYTCEWQDWSTHPMKQKAIAYYGFKSD